MKELRAYANDERNPTMAEMVDVRACVWFQSTSEMFSTYDSTCWPPDQQQSALDFEEEKKIWFDVAMRNLSRSKRHPI